MKPRRTATRVIATALLGVFILDLAGWGGARSASKNSSPILIGEVAGTTGAYGTTGIAMVNAAELAVKQINATGGILGRKVTLQHYNDNASPTVSAQEFKRLVSAGAVAITGSGDTGPTTAAMAERLHVPNIGVVDDGGVTVYPNGPSKPPLAWVFDFGLNTYAWGGLDAKYALKHCSALAVLHDPASYGVGGNQGILFQYTAAHKTPVVDDTITENWSTGATVGLTSEINKIKRARASCVVVWLTPQDTAAFVQQAKSLGAEFTILGNDEINADPTFSSLAGQAANGAIGATLTALLHPNAQLKTFSAAYQKAYGSPPTPFADTTYDSIMMLRKAIMMAHSTDAEALRNAFNHIHGFVGTTGVLGFTLQNHTTIGINQLTMVKYNAAKHAWLPFPW